jgi:hypothetical protein
VWNALISLLLFVGFQAPIGIGSVEGTVTLDGTATPIANVNVTLNDPTRAIREVQATTDEAGRFAFRNLAAGSYYLTTGAPGYVRPYNSASTKAIRVTADGVTNGDLTLARTASIKGRVQRRDGSPVANAAVLAIPTTYVGNQAWLGTSSTYGAPGARTNAQGEYEILNVNPMEYYVVAGEARAGWRPDGTYYPNAIHPSDAKSVIATTGASLVVDIEYQDVLRYKVSGKVLPELPPGVTSQVIALYLVHKDTRVRDDVPPNDISSPSRISSGVFQPDTNAITTFQNGLQFEMRDVRPGSYDLIAVMSAERVQGGVQSYPYMGYATVDVRNSDIDNVSVIVRPGVIVSGNAPFMLRPIGTTPHAGNLNRFADGISETRTAITYSMPNVPPGTYAVAVDREVVSDIRQNGQSIFDTGLVVGTSEPAPLDIIISRSPGSVRGMGQGPNSHTTQYAWVSVVPSPPHRENLILYRGVRADAQGRFNLPGITPGEYKIFTFCEIPYFAGTHPGFVSRYESFGVPITIKEGENLAVNPSVIPLQ